MSLCEHENDFDHINMRMISSFRRGKKIYFLPYISGRHWQLLVMSVQDNYALWFCSLHRPPPTQLRQAIDCSIPASMMMDGRSIVKSRKIAWISLKCNRQNGSYECGYYVMYWMTHIVRSHITTSWETRFKTTTPVPEKSLLFIRNACSQRSEGVVTAGLAAERFEEKLIDERLANLKLVETDL
ncbi:uncharacterized protein LOC128195745 [Vigna angularis]|uniref:uncharacterized protein LOC128195745 n=1 Tax=Phaseolus angularis TaxID=3914 RepID=UPI0022B4FAE8|nr:uncharacterized protein LOC128195745 [Vigna angularis]